MKKDWIIVFNNGHILEVTEFICKSLAKQIENKASRFQLFSLNGELELVINLEEVSYFKKTNSATADRK